MNVIRRFLSSSFIGSGLYLTFYKSNNVFASSISNKTASNDFITDIYKDSITSEILENNNNDIFVDIYSKTCETCSLIDVILRQTAVALENTGSNIQIKKMSADENDYDLYLSKKEIEYVPLLLFYPATNPNSTKDKRTAIPFEGVTAKDMIKFLHKHATGTKFNLQQALHNCDNLSIEAASLISSKIDQSLHNSIENKLMSDQPCNELFADMYKEFTIYKYIRPIGLANPFTKEKELLSWRQCRIDQIDQIETYWKKIQNIAIEKLKEIEIQKKRSTSRSNKTRN